MKKLGLFLLVGIFLFSISLAIGLPRMTLAKISKAADISANLQKNVYVESDEVINDNFVQVGETIDVNGTINGDIMVVGGTININSDVQGDVLAAGGTVTVKGNIAGNVRVVGGTITIDAKIGKNASLFGGTISISEDSSIGWSLGFGSGTAEIQGLVGGHVDGGAGQTRISAKVGGNVNIRSEEDGIITISPPAEINGNLTYKGAQEPIINNGSKIKGEVIQKAYLMNTAPARSILDFLGISIWFLRLIKLFGLLVVGLVIISFFKKASITVMEQMKNNSVKSLGWGIVYLIIIPIIALILSLTIIGIPLALIIIALYTIALYLGKVFIGLLIGYWILQYFKKDKKDKPVPLMGAMILGIVLYTILTIIPYLGWLVSFVGTIWALGALLESTKKYLKENK